MTSTAFPRILPCDSSWQRFQGLFPAGGREFLIDFRLPGSGLEPKFSCDPQLYSLLQGYQNVVKHRLKMSTTADDFLLELTAIVKRIFQHTSHIEGLSPLVPYCAADVLVRAAPALQLSLDTGCAITGSL